MFKLKVSNNEEDTIIMMEELKPCELAVIVEDTNGYYGEIVMRTANDNNKHFEVISLSKPGKNCCWTVPTHILVKRLKKGTEVTLVVT